MFKRRSKACLCRRPRNRIFNTKEILAPQKHWARRSFSQVIPTRIESHSLPKEGKWDERSSFLRREHHCPVKKRTNSIGCRNWLLPKLDFPGQVLILSGFFLTGVPKKPAAKCRATRA